MLVEDDESGKEIRSPIQLLKLGNLTKYERDFLVKELLIYTNTL